MTASSPQPLLIQATDVPLVHGLEGTLNAATFIARAQTVASQLPAHSAVLNVSQSHFGFALGFAAALLRDCVTLMPPNFQPETVRLLQQRLHTWRPDGTGEIVCLHDGGDRPEALPALDLRPWLSLAAEGGDQAAAPVPSFPAEQLAAVVFTSGSTGEPSGHLKTWGKLVLNARSAQRRLAWSHGAIVATVPPQHMYGFESSVLLALQGGHALWHGKPMLPADITDALHRAGTGETTPRYLVSTPWHLSLLLDAMHTSALRVPPLGAVLSATAPLPVAQAERIEQTLQAPVFEIYGSTETSQIATHRSVLTSDWELLDGVKLTLEPVGTDGTDPTAWVSEGHVEGQVPLADLVQPLDDRHFRLLGRRADMVNIAGKRHSIAALNAILQRLPGVKDGAFFDPSADQPTPADAAQVQRLCAFVVAPGLNAQDITRALRQHIDPVFLPRPLWLVEALPRNDTSKLPRRALRALYEQLQYSGNHSDGV